MKLKPFLMFLIVCTLSMAHAQTPSTQGATAPQAATSPEVSVPRQQQNTVYDFSDVDILGKLKSPEGNAEGLFPCT